MRTTIVLGVLLALSAPALAQEKVEAQPRYGVAAEGSLFPQDSPKQLLAAIFKAFDRQRVDYVLAHLTDPGFTGAKMNQYYRQKWSREIQDDLELPEAERDRRQRDALTLFVNEVNDHMAAEPKQTLRFFRLLKEGAVEEAGTTARVTLADNPSLTLTLKQFEGRWYMANDAEPERAKPGEQIKPKPEDKPK